MTVTSGEEAAMKYCRARGEKSGYQDISEWLAAEIEEAIDDPRSNFLHDEVMAEMDADIAVAAKPVTRARA
jgi:hypothetical protein